MMFPRRHLGFWLVAAAGVVLPLVLAEPQGRTLLANTLLLCGGTAAISLPIGTLLAFLLVKTDVRGKGIATILLGLMLFLPLYLQAGAWRAGFGTLGWFTPFGWPPLLESWRGAIWVHAMGAIPATVLIVALGLRLIEPELEEMALLDGTPGQVFWHVTLPQSLPAVGLAALWIAVTTASEMTVTSLFFVHTYADELYTEMATNGEVTLDILPGITLVAWLIVASLLLGMRLSPAGRPLTFRPPRVFSLGGWRAPATIGLGLLLLLIAGLPLADLIVQADPHWRSGWSASGCLKTLAESPGRFSRELTWTFGIGALAASAAVGASILLCWPARKGGRWICLPLGATALTWAIPGPLHGIGLINVLNNPNIPPFNYLYDHSIFAPWLVQMLKALPITTLIVWHAAWTVPRELWETAELDGAGNGSQFGHVFLPLRWQAVTAAWLAALTIAVAELGGTILVAPPGVNTLAMRIFDRLHTGADDQVAGVSLVLLGCIGLVGGVALRLLRPHKGISAWDSSPEKVQ